MTTSPTSPTSPTLPPLLRIHLLDIEDVKRLALLWRRRASQDVREAFGYAQALEAELCKRLA